MSNIRVKYVCRVCGKEISYDIPGGNDVEKYKKAKGIMERKGCPFCKRHNTLKHISSDPLKGQGQNAGRANHKGKIQMQQLRV